MQTGLERLLEDPKRWLGGKRVGLLANPTTVNRTLEHAVDLFHAHSDINLTLLFGPEHGIRSTSQMMVGMADDRDPGTGLRVVSLYGDSFDSLSPRQADLEEIDVLVYDIQDVGTRYYTYAACLALCMKASVIAGTEIIVLDRPNPIGGEQVEGGGLQPGLENYCGLYPVPQRHGMTVGELARLYNTEFNIGSNLRVVSCEGWRRHQYFDALELPWVMASPNMPTLDTAIVYPGMCLLEATAVSEGRGTTRPFELFGAPYIDSVALKHELDGLKLPGVLFRPCSFEPAFEKFTGEICNGLQIHVTDRKAFLSYRTGLAVLWAIMKLYPKEFGWRTEAYEFRDDVPALDLLTGIKEVRMALEARRDFDTVMGVALDGIERYEGGRPAALLY